METENRRHWTHNAELRRCILIGLIDRLSPGFYGRPRLPVGQHGQHEAFGEDPGVLMTPNGIRKLISSKAVVGDAVRGIEVTSSLPTLNNPLAKGHYAYRFRSKRRLFLAGRAVTS